MKTNGAFAPIKQLLDTIRPMPFKDKINHIMTSYTYMVAIIGLVIALLFMSLAGLIFPGPEEILTGFAINVNVSEEGILSITDDFVQLTESEPGNKTTVVETHKIKYTDNSESMVGEDAIKYMELLEKISLYLSAQKLDYIITDYGFMDSMNFQDFCVDLTQFLTEDELASVKDLLVYMEVEETGATVPVAVDISGTEFAKAFISSKNTCISFAENTKRPDTCRSLLQYILNWSGESNV